MNTLTKYNTEQNVNLGQSFYQYLYYFGNDLIHFRASSLVLPGILLLKPILPLIQMTIPPPKRKARG